MDRSTKKLGPKLAQDGTALALGFLAILLLPQQNLLVLALVSLVAGVRLAIGRDVRELATFVAGFLLGSAADGIQVALGVYTYASPDVWVLPCFMFPLWGLVFLLLWDIFLAVDAKTGVVWPAGWANPAFALSAASFAVASVAVGLAYGHPLIVAGIALVEVLILLAFDRREGDGIIVVLAGLIGPAAEAVLVHGGVYTFAAATVFGMPAWHPFYWIVSALFLRRVQGRGRHGPAARADQHPA